MLSGKLILGWVFCVCFVLFYFGGVFKMELGSMLDDKKASGQ